jgi:hypothetical protein
MKKLFLLILVLSYQQSSFAQGVGINTITPDPSTALDIQSSNKGVLLPRVALVSTSDGSTIANPAHALLIFNTTDNALLNPGYYYNSGTAASPLWKSVNELDIPYNNSSSPAGVAFQIDNYNGGAGATALKGYAAGSGTGVYAQSDNGTALQVDGKMKIVGNGQSPVVGKVLTSDNFGFATWQDPRLPDVAFSASNTVAMAQIAANIATAISFDSKIYDLANNFNSSNSIFTAPVTGVYHFNAQIWYNGDVDNPDENYSSTLVLTNLTTGPIFQSIVSTSSQIFGAKIHTISYDTKLIKGEQVQLIFRHTLTGGIVHIKNADLGGPTTLFSGRLVIKL